MKLTQEMIDEIQRLMEHTKKDGSMNWVDGEDIEISLSARETLEYLYFHLSKKFL